MAALLFFVAAVGVGSVLEFVSVPQGLLLGSLFTSALLTRRLKVSPSLRLGLGYVQVVLGISTGLAFQSFDGFGALDMLPSFCFLLVCLAMQMAIGGFWLRKAERWNSKDAILAVYPGALAAVFDLLESEKASNKVMVVQVVRLLSITLIVSLCVTAPGTVVTSEQAPLNIQNALYLLSLVLVCLLSGRLLSAVGVPAPFMLTAIILTGIYLKLGYLHGFRMPQWSVDLAAIILGVLIGSKFKDIAPSEFFRHGRAGLVSVMLMLLTAGAFAGFAGWFLDNDPFTLWMAYMPGAIETVAIVALSGGLNVVFILSHHLVRMILLHGAPALLVLIRRNGKNG
ncbi:AbrB family transcriptional regulator [Pseudomonas syringae]|uniref:Ammonia monooxygenase n=1 Tax=Pseudomonas syringae TaxID=317 RepID=A0A085VC46_PSESX|nr:AbrB family transcriptional regulator [Pseudomonas syringae]KFE53009.1 ammonia monooxygenase [Pseudomonas syringae]